MADLAERRREARRQKILQNSENRINRLLGKPSSEDTDSTPREQSPVSAFQDNDNGDHIPTVQPDVISSHSAKSPVGDGLSTNSSTIHGRPPLSAFRVSQSTSSNVASERGNSVPGEKKHTAQEAKELLKILENMRLVSCIIVAVFIRWVLSSGYGIFYFQTIFLPFILLEIGLYSFHYTYMKEITLPHTSSMMSGALMLCGIKQDLVTLYNRIMGYFAAITEDFALYLFTFIMCNAVMT